VHTVLRRLVEADEVQDAERKGEKVFHEAELLSRVLTYNSPSPTFSKP
jgi:hypothetical protein